MTNNDLFSDLLPPHVEFTDEDWFALCAADDRKEEIKRLHAEIKALTASFASKLDSNRRMGIFPNGTIYMVKTVEKKSFDAKNFELENPDKYAEYCKTKVVDKSEIIVKGVQPREVSNDDDY